MALVPDDVLGREANRLAYQDSIERQCFESFKRLTVSSSKDLTLDLVETMCQRGLTDFLIHTEGLITERDRTSICHYNFIDIQRSTPFTSLNFHNANNYANYLVEVGRLPNFKLASFSSLIRVLLRGNINVLHKALASLMTIKFMKMLEYIEDLCDIYMEDPESRITLIDKMGEVGLLSSTEARTFLLNKMAPRHAWETACLKVPSTASLESLTRISLELLCDSFNNSYKPMLSFNAVRGMNFVTDLAICILKFFLSKSPEEVHQDRIARMVFDGTFIDPRSLESLDHVVFELFFCIHRSAPNTIIQRLRIMLTTSPSVPERSKNIYHRAANAAFSHLCHSFQRKLPRIDTTATARIKEIFLGSARFIDFKLCDTAILFANCEVSLTRMALEEFQARFAHDASYKDVADTLFAKALSQCIVSDQWFELLDTYHVFVGDKTCSILINHTSIGWYDHTSHTVDEILGTYVSEHLEEYIRAILERFPMMDCEDLTRLPSVVSRAVGKLGSKIILAGRVYTCTRFVRNNREIGEERLGYPTCTGCKRNIEKHVYTDSALNFDAYFCNICAFTRGSVTVSKVTCPVCLSDEPPIIGNGCGHVSCLSCINKINGICPLCRAKIPSPEIYWMTQEFVVQRFLAEWKGIVAALPPSCE